MDREERQIPDFPDRTENAPSLIVVHTIALSYRSAPAGGVVGLVENGPPQPPPRRRHTWSTRRRSSTGGVSNLSVARLNRTHFGSLQTVYYLLN
uniref:Uncharacterized protein n=1 Tax=Timema genevievae TaxID=629358 RepID=A0A7R9PII9_TIMGE|nr:unnamed protein product [Timema genevievae]